MEVPYRRLSVICALFLLTILLVFNGIVIRHQLAVQVVHHFEAAHTQELLIELSETQSTIKDAETGQRGFLYTEDPKYLTDYQRAVEAVGSHLSHLRELSAGDPVQQASVTTLQELSRAKLSELAETIALYRSGKPEKSKALVKSDKGLLLMNGIRKLVSDMGNRETSLAASRSTAYEKSVRVTIACIYLASFVAILGVGLLAYFILRELRLREAHGRLISKREEWFRITLTGLGDGVIATDELGSITFLNPIAEDLIGVKLEAVVQKPIQEVFRIFNESTHQPVENPIEKVIAFGRVVGLANHTVLLRADGIYTPIEDSASPIYDDQERLVGVVMVFRDATHDRKMQELMRKSEKLAAAARLASTVAHEINNPLQSIGDLIFITKNTPEMPPSAIVHLSQAEEELERVSHITRQTLGFYRESKTPSEVEMPALVESVLRIYTNKLRTKNIAVRREFGECPPLLGLSGELKQVVANLISNAADAVGRDGTICVNLACVELEEKNFIQISVADDGSGIPSENLDSIFEAFFTTKNDVGTGLGLWVTKEIVDRHGGTIRVQSGDNTTLGGALFEILLPIAGKRHAQN